MADQAHSVLAGDGVGDDNHKMPLRVARQGIFNSSATLMAHELLFRGVASDAAQLPSAQNDESSVSAHDSATSQVITHTFGVFGIEDLGGGKPLFINMTRAFLVGEIELPFGPEGVVLEVLENIECDDELIAGVKNLKEQGYCIALDDFDGEMQEALLPHVNFVKVDFASSKLKLAGILQKCQDVSPDIQLIVERIETEEDFQWSRAAGFEYFQGYYFQRPVLLEHNELSPSQVICLRLMNLLTESSPDPAELEALVSADPFLAIRILRTANSVSIGLSRRISSIRQALVLLGPKGLNTWVMLTLIGGGARAQQYRVTEVLVRSGFAELLAAKHSLNPSVAATIGMIAGMSSELGKPLHKVAASAGLEPQLVAQLDTRTGPFGTLMNDIEAYEQGRTEDVSKYSTLEDLSESYLKAWTNALRVASTFYETTGLSEHDPLTSK